MKIAVLPGDGIGPEIVAQAAKVLDALRSDGLKIELEYAHIGGAGYDAAGDPLPDATLKLAKDGMPLFCCAALRDVAAELSGAPGELAMGDPSLSRNSVRCTELRI